MRKKDILHPIKKFKISNGVKKLIINADDFGLTGGVNRGIIEGHQKGVITSTTLMANMLGFEDAVRLARQNPHLGVGIHLNIYRGKPLFSPSQIPSLLNQNGEFFSSFKLAKKIYQGKINLKEVEEELKAQIIKVKEAGINITHLDSEKHFHCFPQISAVVLKLAAYFNIRKIRLPREHWSNRRVSDLFSPQFYKMQYLASRSRALIPLFQKQGIKYIDNFYGILYSGKTSLSSFLEILENIPQGISELMVHPGYVDAELKGLNNNMVYSREKELKILLHPEVKRSIKVLEIQLVNYNEL